MDGRTALTHNLRLGRITAADSIRARSEAAGQQQLSPLLVRSLVASVAQAIDTSNPAPVVAWSRMALTSAGAETVQHVVETACDLAAEEAEPLELDFSAVLVFLEIVKANVAESMPSEAESATAQRRSSPTV